MTTVGQIAGQRGLQGRQSAPRAPRTSMLRPVPERVPELAHMDVKRLRRYRQALLHEELRTSYWRRLIQARRDLLRADVMPGDRVRLVEVLTEARSSSGRTAIMSLHPDGGMPILPHLPDLWASGAAVAGDAEHAALHARLASAESVLSSYREALHRRVDRATADLVARYHQEPAACLSALPSATARRTSVR